MNTLKLAALALTTSAILTGCGGDGGSDAPATPQKTKYSYAEDVPLFIDAYEQVDVTRVYFVNVRGQYLEVHTTNGNIDGDSQNKIDDIKSLDVELANCANYIGTLRETVSEYFNHVTPTQDNRYEVGGNDAKFVGMVTADLQGNESL
ncbi:hypothetical protein L1D34_10390 [Vibrio mediterranei]|uniref:hypothetical protein n=1 Tax=Vibrio mediterranei TaxID=689 RepID=UPI001EFED8E3|nr:hypothetical protein [Vibrio mediterranei]MCG9625250.1 hypothetical protein [Vibrio mediterranei]